MMADSVLWTNLGHTLKIETFLSPESLMFIYLAHMNRPFAAKISVYLAYFNSKDKFRMVDKEMHQ